MLKYRYTIELWKYEADVVKSSLEKAEDLIEGVWNTCSDVIDDWGIDEIEESLESFMPKAEDVEQVRASSKADINNLSVLYSKSMYFSVISLAKMTARVEENAQLARKGIKEIAALTIKGHLRAQSTEGPKAGELIELNNKWLSWENSLGKASDL